jgi:hypothetical protein
MEPTYQNEHKDIPGNPSTAKSSQQQLNQRRNGEPLRALTEEQWKHWITQGYVVVPNAISSKQVAQTVALLWEFEEKNPKDPKTWYAPPRATMEMKELVGTGMVEVYNHQHQWINRQTPRVYDAFVDVWGTEELWVTIDRANLNFPAPKDQPQKGFIHWDYDPDTKPQNVQGVLALCDQIDPDMGGFQCIPWLFQNYESWRATQPDDRDPFQPDLKGLKDKIKKVPLMAGDLLIFHSGLAHGIRPNNSLDKVRMAQYISMMPAEPDNEDLKNWRINSWKNRVAPEGYAFPGDPRNWEQTRYETAQLSPLGEKLLGLTPW